MSAEFKSRTQKALDRYLRRQQQASVGKRPPSKIRSVKNLRPEKDLVQMPCMIWMKQQGFSVEIYESKAVWDSKAQSYVTKGMKSGTPDCMGCTNQGYAVYIEFKAPGRRATLKPHQRHFLITKAQCGAFACVIDDLEYLKAVWVKWIAKRVDGHFNEAKAFLLDLLQGDVKVNDASFFNDDK